MPGTMPRATEVASSSSEIPSKRLEQTIGFRPTIPIETIVDRVIADVKEREGG